MKQQNTGDKEKILKDTKNKVSYKGRTNLQLSSATRDARSQQINFQK